MAINKNKLIEARWSKEKNIHKPEPDKEINEER